MSRRISLPGCLMGIAFACAPGGNANAADTTVIDNVAFTQPQRMIRIDTERRLNLYCAGEGHPAVIFDAGLGDSAKAWGLVQPDIARLTMACSYDRAGLGFSDPSTEPATSEQAVSDLHRLLDVAKLARPVILVGHSYGGMNVKLYAEKFPSEVAGLVMVDPSHEDLGRDTGRIDPKTNEARATYLADLQKCLHASERALSTDPQLGELCVPGAGPRYSAQINAVESELGAKRTRVTAWIGEMTNVWGVSADQVRSSNRTLGAIPIRVLTKFPSLPAPGETQEMRDAKNAMWIRLHDEIANMSSNGRRTTVADTGHYIQLDQPKVVVESIGSVIQASRDRGAPAP